MASFDIVTWNSTSKAGKRAISSSTTFDFLSIKVGASALEIKETSGNFDFSAKKLTNIVGGTGSGEALSWSQIGQASGVAGLDGGGKVPVAQLPNSIMEFQGVWNATTNSPTLADATGNIGDVYRVNTAGTQNLGSGSQTFVIGDWVMYDAAGIWRSAHSGADAVNSVFGRSGVVTASNGDYTASQITNVAAGDISSVTVQAAINELDTEKVATTRTVNGHALSADVTVTKGDVGLGSVDNLQQLPLSYLDTDNTLAADSDAKVASQKAIKAYVTSALSGVTVDYTKNFVNDNAGTVTVRQVAYVKSNGAADLALATTSGLELQQLAIVSSATIATTATGAYTVIPGAVIAGFSGLTPGQKVYVHRTTAGGTTQSLVGFVTGEKIYRIGYAITATTLLFDPAFEIEL